MTLPALFGHHFQIAYVVRDTEAAIRVFAGRCGMARWQRMDMLALRGPDSATRSISLAYSGSVMIELIEANPSVPSIYAGWAEATGSNIRLHHLGFLIRDAEQYAGTVRGLEEGGFRCTGSGRVGDQIEFHYADTTATFGHYYELVHLLPAGESFFSRVPRHG